MDIVIGIANAINFVLTKLLQLLPDSPFTKFIKFEDTHDILGMINFFIPFDIFSEVMTLWIGAVSAYYVYCFVKGTLSSKNSIIDKFFKFIA